MEQSDLRSTHGGHNDSLAAFHARIEELSGANHVSTTPQGLYVGRSDRGSMWAGPQRSMLVLGPPRSGKTSSLVIPNVLLADGAVVSTSTKPDVMAANAAWRGRKGWTLLYDPSGEMECPPGVERVGWSPLATADQWDTAVQTADAMVRSSRLVAGRSAPAAAEFHWTERAGALLAPLLHAAALEGADMKTVLRWIDRHDGTTALEILSSNGGDDSAPSDLLTGIVSTDGREQSGIWSTASGVLGAYRTRSAMETTALPALTAEAFCDGPNTLFICAPGRRQHQFAPLVVGALGEVRDAAYRRHRDGGPFPPVLLALDEVANIAPIPDLPGMVSEGAGQGLLVLACLQDLSQARARWGTEAAGFLSLFGTTVVLPGIADTATLRDLSALGGEAEVRSTTLSQSVGRYGRLRPSSSHSTVRLARYPVDALARGADGCAMVVTPHKSMEPVMLTPAHRCSPFREMVEQARIRACSVPESRTR